MTSLPGTMHLVCAACAFAAMGGCVYLLLAAWIVQRWTVSAPPAIPLPPPVTILKPLHGEEPGLERRLLSFGTQRYDGAIQLVLGCQNASDLAIPVARRVAARRPGQVTDLVVGDRIRGSNRKVSNLLHCHEHALYDVIVLADSDIEVDETYLRHVVEALAQPDVRARPSAADFPHRRSTPISSQTSWSAWRSAPRRRASGRPSRSAATRWSA